MFKSKKYALFILIMGSLLITVGAAMYVTSEDKNIAHFVMLAGIVQLTLGSIRIAKISQLEKK